MAGYSGLGALLAYGYGIYKGEQKLADYNEKINSQSGATMTEKIQAAKLAFPELANDQYINQMEKNAYDAETRQLDMEAKRKAAADQKTVDNFKQTWQIATPKQREAMYTAAPDLTAKAMPEEYQAREDAKKAAQEQDTWLNRYNIQEAGDDADTAAANARDDRIRGENTAAQIAKDIATGVRNPDGSFVTQEQKNTVAREQAKLLKEQELQLKANAEKKAKLAKLETLAPQFEKFVESVDSADQTMGKYWGTDEGNILSMQYAVGSELAKASNSGGVLSDQDRKGAIDNLLPLPGLQASINTHDGKPTKEDRIFVSKANAIAAYESTYNNMVAQGMKPNKKLEKIFAKNKLPEGWIMK